MASSQAIAADTASPSQPAEPLIAINFPENIEIRVLVDYVSQRLGINILYDEQILNKRITLKATTPIPRSSLLNLLESALRMKGLVLVDAGQDGWKRIVPANDLLQISPPFTQPPKLGGLPEKTPLDVPAATHIVALEHADPKRAEQVLKPFLSTQGANLQIIPEQRLLIVTDYTTNLPRIMNIIKLVDQAQPEITLDFLPVEHMDALQLAQQITQLLLSKQKAKGQPAALEGIDLTHDPRTNRLVLAGLPGRIEEIKRIAARLDVKLTTQTRVYHFKTAAAERVDRIIKELAQVGNDRRQYRSIIDRESGMLVVTTTAAIHDQIIELKDDLDKPIAEQQSPIRFYKLQNATAADVLATIRTLETGSGLSNIVLEPSATSYLEKSAPGSTPGITPTSGNSIPGSSAPGSPPGITGQPSTETSSSSMSSQAGGTSGGGEASGGGGGDEGTSGGDPVLRTVRSQQATVTADKNTNTIIVIADPAIQAVYEKLIHTLDRRRPQVLVEISLITLDTSNGFSLGVEISRLGSIDGDRLLNFSSFGLSEVDANTGQLTLTPGIGFNGALVSADIADIIVRALSTSGKARVVSAPKILVNDNATGTLTSVNEAPFSSVNASDTVATTSFGGFVSAGTTISVTPHISEGDHLSLEYAVSLNSFTGTGTDSLPPPRQTNSVQSHVTVPNGQTIIVGGLTRKDSSFTKEAVPFLGNIPILEYLFSNRTQTESESTLFVFIRPIIVRDDNFQDLKFYSEQSARRAGLEPRHPQSLPVTMK